MAALVRQLQLPTTSQITLLQELGRTVSVRHSKLIPGATVSQVVISSAARDVQTSIEYRDIEFKFEYFYLVFRTPTKRNSNDVSIFEKVSFDEIEFLIRGEWKEIDPQGTEVFKRGPVEKVPSDAPASISCVGIKLRHRSNQLLLGIADGFPLVMEISQDVDVIRSFESDCTVVNINEAIHVFDEIAKDFLVSA